MMNNAMDRLKSKPYSVRAWQFPILTLCKYPDPHAEKDNHIERDLLFTSGYFFVGLIKFLKKFKPSCQETVSSDISALQIL